MQRRQLLIAAPWLVGVPALSWAQNKTVRLVVPFAAGGSSDIVARAVGEQLAKELGQPVIVDNKAGAGGSIGMAEVARAAPDGLTLGLATMSTHGVNPAVYKSLPYDPDKGFTPVAELVKAPGVLVVTEKLGVSDYASFIKLLNEKPGKLSYGSSGIGSIGHMWGELFKAATKTHMVHIPYRGAGAAANDMLAGVIQVGFDQVASSLPFIKNGKLRALAVSWHERLDVLPDVPTFSEVGNDSNSVPSWFGLVAPAGTPDDVVKRLHAATTKSLASPGMKGRLAALGLYPSTLATPQQFGVQIRKEIDRMQRVARFAKIQLD
jgi:tripartite-type tricarboxylate transporter receptor subunit TctC